MGKDLYERSSYAKEIFEKADGLLGFKLTTLCFEGPLETLTRTRNSQPAIFVTSAAALAALTRASKNPYQPQATCGLSLGEYTALYAAGVLSFEEALRAVAARGRFMEEASEKTAGTLAALFGLNLQTVEALCEKTGTEVANLNCPDQIVVSGRLSDIERVMTLSKEAGAKRAIRLEVSGPFHSRFMKEAGEALEKVLETLPLQKPSIPFVSNVTAHFEEDPVQIRGNLVRQVSQTVFWEESMRSLIGKGIRRFVEIGPGKVLTGLLRKIDPTVACSHVETFQEIETL